MTDHMILARVKARLFRVLMLGLLVLVAGCASPAPRGPRPQLPEGDPFPELNAEEVVERIELLGFQCGFDPGGDIQPGWVCLSGNQAEGDWMQVSLGSEETGPISHGFALLFREDQGPDFLDHAAASRFHEILSGLPLPEEAQPSEGELLEAVRANWPTEIGDGWVLGFDRNSNSRSMQVRYVDP